MASPVDLLWRVRAVEPTLDLATGSHGQPAINPRGDVLVSPALPVSVEQTRFGCVWGVRQTTPTAPGTSLPTTLAGITLWNGSQYDGPFYLIRRIFALVTTTAAAASPVGLCHLINLGPTAAPTSAGLTIRGASGNRYKGAAVVGVGITVVDDGWEPIGTSAIAPTSQLAAGVEAKIDGLYLVPPGYRYSVFVLMNSGAVARTIAGIEWCEVPLTMSRSR